MVALPITAAFSASGLNAGSAGETETDWGYEIATQDAQQASRLGALEAVVYVIGLGFVALTASLWLLPGSSFSPAIVGLKAALSYAVIMGGFALTGIARRGFSQSVQVDTARKQVRVVWVNRKGEMTLKTVFDFNEIGTVFVDRRKFPNEQATLNMKFGDKQNVIEIASGDADSMRTLWQRLLKDLQPNPTGQSGLRSSQPMTHKKPAPQSTMETKAMRRKVFSGASGAR